MILIVSRSDPPSPALTLLREELIAVTHTLNSSLIFCKITKDLRGEYSGHGFCHIKNREFGPRKALLDFPFIGSVRGLHDGASYRTEGKTLCDPSCYGNRERSYGRGEGWRFRATRPLNSAIEFTTGRQGDVTT